MAQEIGEASVLIRPDTSQFRTLLQAQLTEIINTAVVPPVKVPVIAQGLAGTTVATSTLAASNEKAAASAIGLQTATKAETSALGQQQVILNKANDATRGAADAHRNVIKNLDSRSRAEHALARDIAERSRQESQALRGAAATGLSLFGLRGATLAASAPFLAGAAAITAFAKSVGAASSVQSNLNAIQAVLGATAAQMAQVRTESKALAADVRLPAVSALDATTAIRALAQAGLDLQKSLQAARPALLLARAAEVDVGTAAQDIASQLNSFALAAGDAGHVADVLALSAHKSQQSLQDVSSSLEVIAPISRQFGISLNDSAALLSLLAQNGVRGAAGANVLRFAIVRLLAPTKGVGAELGKLGVVVRDAEGNFRPEVFREIEVATRKLTPALRESALATIFGARSLRVQAALGQESIRTLEQTRAEFTRQGTAQQEAALRAQGLAGRARELRASLEDVAVSIGRSVTPGLTGFVSGLTASVQAISSSQQVRQTLGDSVSLIGQAFKTLEGTIRFVGPTLLTIAGAFQSVASSIGLPAIVAGVAAYKLFLPVFFLLLGRAVLLKEVFTAVSTAIKVATAETAGLATASAVSSVALKGIVGGLASLISPTTAITLGAAALAAGLVVLFTRESELDQANQALSHSSQQAADAIGALDEAVSNTRRDASDLVSAHLSIRGAILAREKAERDLATSSSAQGSPERRQLELGVAQAINAVTQARLQEADAIRRAGQDKELEAAQRQKTQRALAREASDIERVVRALEHEAAARAGAGARGAVGFDPVRRAQSESDAIDHTIVKLRELAEARRQELTVGGLEAAKRLDLLAALAEKIKQVPTEKQIGIVINARSIPAALNQLVRDLGIKGQAGAEAFKSSLLAFMVPPQDRILALFKSIFDGIIRAASGAGKDTGDNFVSTLLGAIAQARGRVESAIAAIQQGQLRGVRQGRGRLAGLQEQFTQLQIGGASSQQLLANLSQQESIQRRIVEGLKKHTQARREAEKALNDIIQQEAGIQGNIASAAQAGAAKQKEARDKADQAVLATIGLGEQKRQNALVRAQQTETLADDVRAEISRRNFYRRKRDEVKKTVQDAKTRADEIRTLNQDLFNINLQIRGDEKKRQEQIRQQRQDAADARLQILQTEIATAQITGNRVLQRRLLNAEIAELENQIRGAKRGSLKRAQLLQELRQAQKDLNDLKTQTDKNAGAAKALQQAEFAFLQTQQGFAANLISNLIPLGATGLVGGATAAGAEAIRGLSGAGGFPPPEKGARAASTAAQAGRDRGVTTGQGSTQIQILRAILQALVRLNRGAEHPEAHHQRRIGSAIMDYHGESAGM